MIGLLRGRLLHKQPPQILLDCAGVGYEIETPLSTFLELPAIGDEVELHTHLAVREDAHTLYGFSTAAEKQLFRALLKVNGVGAKLALSILSAMSVSEFSRCVQREDSALLTKIPGVGKKTAERLIIDLRDRLDKPAVIPGGSLSRDGPADAASEAFDALVTLGYKPAEVKRLIGKLDAQQLSAEDIIRQALRKAVT